MPDAAGARIAAERPEMQSPIAHSPLHLTVLYAALGVWLIPEWIGGYFQHSEAGATRRDRGSHLVLVVSLLAGVAAAFACVSAVPQAGFGPSRDALFWVGIALMLAGVGFRWYAIRVLGRFFSRDVATRAGQVVVETGPYRLIRHPSYSGGLLTVLGLGLALGNWLSLLVLLAGSVVGYGYRVRVEERALCEALGASYRDYMKRTRRFVPYLW